MSEDNNMVSQNDPLTESTTGDGAIGKPLEKALNEGTIVEGKKKVIIISLVLVGILLVVAVILIRQYTGLKSLSTDASCYGYSCEPFVILGGGEMHYEYGAGGVQISYGSTAVQQHGYVVLTWNAANVEKCFAVGGWNNSTATYLPPTLFSTPIGKYRTFEVRCSVGGRIVASSILDVAVYQYQGNLPPIEKPPTKGTGRTRTGE